MRKSVNLLHSSGSLSGRLDICLFALLTRAQIWLFMQLDKDVSSISYGQKYEMNITRMGILDIAPATPRISAVCFYGALASFASGI